MEPSVFITKFLEEFRLAEVKSMALVLKGMSNTDEEGQRQLEEEMNEIVKEGGSLSQFILIVNMKDHMNFDDTLSLLKDIRINGELSEKELEDYIGQSQEAIDKKIALEYETPPSHRVVRIFRRVGEYLRQHPAVAVIPIALFMAAGAAHGIAYGADLNHAGPGHIASQADIHVDQPQQSLAFDHVVGFGSKGAEITKIGSILLQHVNADDIRALAGKVNNVSNLPYDSDYFLKNADKIIQHASQDVHHGFYTRDVERVTAAFQFKNHLRQTTKLTNQDFDKLNSLAGNTTSGKEAGGAPPPHQLLATNLEGPAILPIQARLTQVAVTGNKEIYSYPINAPYKLMQPADVKNNMVTQTGGVITGLHSQEKNYDHDTTVMNVLNEENKHHIEELNGNIKVKENRLKEAEHALKNGGASLMDVVKVNLELTDLKKQSADARLIEQMGYKKVPYNATFKDFKIAEGDTVAPGTVVGEYYDRERVRFDIEIPDNVYFQNVAVSIDGQPVQNSFWFNWDFSPTSHHVWVSFIVTPAADHPIAPGQNVKFHASFYAPDKSPHLPIFKGKGTTTVPIDPIKEYKKQSPAPDKFTFKVNQGDRFKRGQSLVVGDPEPYKTKLEYVLTQIEGEKLKLGRVSFSNGDRIINGEDEDKIIANINNLQKEEGTLRDVLAHLDIKADQDGYVVWTAKNGTDIFQKDNDLIRVVNDTVFLGNFKNDQYSINFPVGVKRGDVVQGITPVGPVYGVVSAVDPTPHVSTGFLGPVNSVELTMYDPNRFERQNMRIPFTLLTDKEKESVLATGILKDILSLPQTGGAPPPLPDPVAGFASGLFKTDTVQFTTPQAPQVYYPPQEPVTSRSQIKTEVAAHAEVLLAPQYLDVVQKTLHESDPKDRVFKIFANLYAQKNANGKLGVSGFGGVSGMVNGISGGLTSGYLNFVGSIFGQLLGDAVDTFDGKIGKEVARNHAWKLSSDYTLQAAHAEIFHVTDVLYDRLAVVQQDIASSKALMDVLKEEQREIQVAESDKLIVHTDTLKFNGEIIDLQDHVTKIKNEEQSLIDQLNNLRGQKIIGGPRIVAELPLTGVFAKVTDEQKDQWLKDLIGPNSKNPRLQKARADLDAVKADMKVAGLKKLPSLNVGTLIPNASIASLPFDPFPGAIDRTTNLTGPGGFLQAGFDIKNQRVSKEIKDFAYQKDEAEKEIVNIERNLEEELSRTINQINADSQGIQGAEEGYKNDYQLWEIPASQRGVFVPYQYDAQRQKLTTDSRNANDLKKDYWEAQENLEKMGVHETVVKLVPNPTDKAQVVRSSLFRNFMFGIVSLIALAVGKPLLAQDATTGPTAPETLSHQIIINNDPQGMLNDSNSEHRKQALDALEKSQGINALETIALSSPSAERHELLRFILDSEPPDLPFLIQTINNAAIKHNRPLVDQGFQLLDDFLTMHPEGLENLTPDDLRNGDITAEIVNKVLVNYLVWAPDNSIGRERLLRSNSWATDYWKSIFNAINARVNTGRPINEKLKEKLIRLSGLVKASVFIKEAGGNIDDVFRPGEFAHFGAIVLEKDLLSFVEMTKNPEETRRFLGIASEPWTMSTQGFLNPDLQARAKDATDKILSDNPSDGDPSVFYDLPDASSQPNELAYFQSLDPEGKVEYIYKLQLQQSMPELARILILNTSSRGLILNYLTAKPQGRILALRIYVESNDTQLKDLIYQRFQSLQNQLKVDIAAVRDSTSNRIIRLALEKMYKSLKDDWMLNLRLKTFTNLELHLAQDPRGLSYVLAEIKVRAIEIGMRYHEEYLKDVMQWLAGFGLQDPQEIKELGDIKVILNQTDPVKANADFDSQLQRIKAPEVEGFFKKPLSKLYAEVYKFVFRRDPGAKGVIDDIATKSEEVASRMQKNDQTIPPIPVLWYFTVGILTGIPVLFTALKRIIKEFGFWNRENDVVATLMYIASQTNDEQFKGLKVEKRKDGLKILNIPAPKPKGTVSESQMEKGLVWKDISKKLIDNGWAIEVSETEILLAVNLAETKEDMIKVFGKQGYENLYPLLKKALNGKTDEEQEVQKNLRNWRDLVDDWNGKVRTNTEKYIPGEEVVRNFQQMKKYALNVVKFMPYTANQMESPSAVAQSNLFYFTRMANYSLYLLENILKSNDLTDDQKDQLRKDIRVLVKIVKYATHFSLVLHYRTILNRVFNRKLHQSHEKEVTRWYLLGESKYSLARRFLYFEWLMWQAKEAVERNVEFLLDEGNNLIPGLYPSPTKIIKKNNEVLQEVIEKGGTPDARAHHATLIDKIGNFWREYKYPIQLSLSFLSTVGLAIGIRPFVSFGVDITFTSLYFLFWSWYWYSYPNWDAMNTKSWGLGFKGNIALAEKQESRIKEKFAPILVDAAQTSNKLPSVVNAGGGISDNRKSGGIDLNFHPQYIEQFSRGSSSPSKGFAVYLSESFKGFNFNIVRFTPNLTVNGAFQLMFDLN